MYPSYDDIRSRIAEEPAWWDAHGVPRYGRVPAHLLPFMGRIACQSCGERFRVCLVGEVYQRLHDEGIHFSLGDPCPADPRERHLKIELAPAMQDVHTGPLPLPDNWHYGDPPAHGCVGDSMNSIPEYEWEAFGVVEEALLVP